MLFDAILRTAQFSISLHRVELKTSMYLSAPEAPLKSGIAMVGRSELTTLSVVTWALAPAAATHSVNIAVMFRFIVVI